MAFLSLAQNPHLTQAAACVRRALVKMHRLYGKFVSYVSRVLCNQRLIFLLEMAVMSFSALKDLNLKVVHFKRYVLSH